MAGLPRSGIGCQLGQGVLHAVPIPAAMGYVLLRALHGDLIHSVGEVTGQQGWGNVMYVPAAPYWARNAAYARACGQAFLSGASPGDFAAEDYETSWTGRATPADLNDTGRKQLGLQPW